MDRAELASAQRERLAPVGVVLLGSLIPLIAG